MNKFLSMNSSQLEKMKSELSSSKDTKSIFEKAFILTPDVVSPSAWTELEELKKAVIVSESPVLNSTSIKNIYLMSNTEYKLDLVIDTEFSTDSMDWCKMCFAVKKHVPAAMVYSYKEDFEKQNENFDGLTDGLRKEAAKKIYYIYMQNKDAVRR